MKLNMKHSSDTRPAVIQSRELFIYFHSTAPVTQDDFPTTEQIKRKLSCFEEQFARSLADKYAGLADTLQLSALPIAISRDPDGAYRYIKLLDYLEGETVPLDLLSENPERYVMMMPEALFHGIMHVRRDKISDLELWTVLARDLVTCVAMEAGNELSGCLSTRSCC